MGKPGIPAGSLVRRRKMNTPQSAPADIAPPEDLSAEAAAFWQRHAANLAGADLLSPGDLDSFRHLCDTWARLSKLQKQLDASEEFNPQLTRNYINMSKQYQTLAKSFCLMPTERRKAAVSFGDGLDRNKDKGSFDF